MKQLSSRRIGASKVVAVIVVAGVVRYAAGRKTMGQNATKPQTTVSALSGGRMASYYLATHYAGPRSKSPDNRERVHWIESSRVLSQLWRNRGKRNIAPEVMEFLGDESDGIRSHAARTLGILEAPEAERALSRELEKWVVWEKQEAQFKRELLEKRTTFEKVSWWREKRVERPQLIPKLTLKVALGRIRSRNLKGRSKLDRIGRELGLTFEDVAGMAPMLGQRMKSQDSSERQNARKSDSYRITVEFIHTLCSMRRQGEDLTDLGIERFFIAPNFKLRLEGAALAPDAEAAQWIDHATSSTRAIFEPRWLLDSSPHATDLLLQRLVEIRADPGKFKLNTDEAPYLGINSLLQAAALSGDARAIPILESYRTIDDMRVRADANSAYLEITIDKRVALLPS